MEIKLKNYETISAINAIKELMDSKLPSKVSWNLSKNFRKLNETIEDFNSCEQKLVRQYAVKDSNGEIKLDERQQFTITSEFVPIFNKERNEYLNCEDTMDIHIIKLSDLVNVEVSPTALYSLDFMIEDDTE